MASVTFSPTGTQLDNDEIADLQVNVGDRLGFSFILDTSGLDAELQSIKLRLEGDPTEIDLIEVNLADTQTDFFQSTFSDVTVIEDNFDSITVELKGEPGAIPDTTNVLVEPETTVIDGLVNDGQADIGVTVLEAIDANGTDVTDLFEPANQGIDLQPPQVSSGRDDGLVFGEGDDDFLYGGDNTDTLLGQGGNDVISGGQGDDLLLGGNGSDTFVFASGEDAIAKLEWAETANLLRHVPRPLAGIALTSGSNYDSLAIEYNAQGNYTNISEESGEPITTLFGVEANQLTESDFTTI